MGKNGTIKPIAIDHICLWVSSLPHAKRYYESLFGLRCTTRQGVADTLIVEGDHVHFFIRQSEANGIESLASQHLAFSVDNLDQVINSLEAMGIANYKLGQVECFEQGNYHWCEWLDPDGIRLECVQYK